MVVETHTTYNNEVKEGDEVEINLTFFDHDKKRLHFKMEMIEKSSKKLSAINIHLKIKDFFHISAMHQTNIKFQIFLKK